MIAADEDDDYDIKDSRVWYDPEFQAWMSDGKRSSQPPPGMYDERGEYVPPEKRVHPDSTKKIEARVVKLFRRRWSSLSRKGRSTIVAEREPFFLSRDNLVRLQMARRYYAPERMTRFSRQPAASILRLCAPWLDVFCRLGWDPSLGNCGFEIEKLVGAEYVALVRPLDCPAGSLGYVYAVPDLTVTDGGAYLDIYRMTAAGFSAGARVRLCKSVATPFGEVERKQVMGGIVWGFLGSAEGDGDDPDTWTFAFRRPVDARVIELTIAPRVGKTRVQEDEITTCERRLYSAVLELREHEHDVENMKRAADFAEGKRRRGRRRLLLRRKI